MRKKPLIFSRYAGFSGLLSTKARRFRLAWCLAPHSSRQAKRSELRVAESQLALSSQAWPNASPIAKTSSSELWKCGETRICPSR